MMREAANNSHVQLMIRQYQRWLTWLLLLLVCLSGCQSSEGERFSIRGTPSGAPLSQWAVKAEASTEFGFPDWAASRATGAPDVPECVDDSLAWASARGSGLEWLELTYAEPVYATGVRIYQTLGRGAVSGVLLVDRDGVAQLIWEGTDQRAPCPGVLEINFLRTSYRVVGVRVELDESRTGFWNQIDAVELSGYP